MQKDSSQLRNRIAKVFTDLIGKPETGEDIAFHMTDWDHNLTDLETLYEQHSTMSDDEISDIVIEFLIHVPNHLAAAKKLSGCGPMEDIFGVGILEEDEDLEIIDGPTETAG